MGQTLWSHLYGCNKFPFNDQTAVATEAMCIVKAKGAVCFLGGPQHDAERGQCGQKPTAAIIETNNCTISVNASVVVEKGTNDPFSQIDPSFTNIELKLKLMCGSMHVVYPCRLYLKALQAASQQPHCVDCIWFLWVRPFVRFRGCI